MTDPLDDPRLTAMGLLIEAYEGLIARLDPVHAEHGLAGKDFDVLIRLARSPGRRLRMTDLAAQTSMSTSGMTRVVDRLERSGLVAREVGPHDRRSLLAALTESGYERVLADAPAIADVIEQWFTGVLGDGRLEPFLAALEDVRNHVRPDAAAGADGHT